MGRGDGVKIGLPLCFAAAAAIAAGCYMNMLRNQFVFDDLDVIVRNPLVTGAGGDPRAIFASHYWAHVTPAGNLYRPLTILSYAINHRISGLDPIGYHVVNLLLHALCSGLVVVLASRLGLARAASMAAGAIFAAHPIHTEAVTGVVGRAELMSTAGVLAAWILHLAPGRSRPARWIAIGLAFGAALLSKENAIVLPALMLAGDLGLRGSRGAERGNLMPGYLACAGVAASWMLLRLWILPPVAQGSIADSVFAGVPAGYRILTALGVLSRYAGLLIFPLRLSADYSFEQIPVIESAWDPLAVCGALLAAIVGVAAPLTLLRRGIGHESDPGDGDGARLPALCAAGFAIAMAPVSNLIVPIGTIMGERLLYLPSAFFCIALPAAFGALASRLSGSPSRRKAGHALRWRWIGSALTAALVTAGGARTLARNADWKDQLTLFSVTVSTSPRSAKAHHNLGVALEDAGRKQEALREYQAAIAIKGDEAGFHYNAGLLLASLGHPQEAAVRLEEARRLDPTLPGLLGSLGAVYSSLGRVREAEQALRAAVDRDPGGHDALYNLGTLLLAQGRATEAVTLLERARGAGPEDPDGRYQLGLAYLASGRPHEAVDELRRAMALAPSLVEAHREMALAYLRLGDGAAAAEEATLAKRNGVMLPPELESLVR